MASGLIVFPLLGGIMQATAMYMLKKLFTLRKASTTPNAPYYHYPIWWFALLLFTLSALFALIPKRGNNATSLLGLTSLITALLYAQFALKEDLSLRDFLVYLTVIAGAVLSLWVVETIVISILLFVLYILFLIFVLALLFLAWKYLRAQLSARGLTDPAAVRQRKVLPAVLAALLAMLQALIYVPVVVFISAYSNTAFVVFVFAAGFVATIAVQVLVLHYALNDFDLIYIVAIFSTTSRLLDFAVTGLFGGFAGHSVLLYLVLPSIGLVLMLVGSFVLSFRENCSEYRMLEMDATAQAMPGFVAYGEPQGAELDGGTAAGWAAQPQQPQSSQQQPQQQGASRPAPPPAPPASKPSESSTSASSSNNSSDLDAPRR